MNRILFSTATSFHLRVGRNPGPKQLLAQTRTNLEAELHGEVCANLQYLRCTDQAEPTGNPALAKQFRESASIETNEHFYRNTHTGRRWTARIYSEADE
jgi:hypothetical protein